MQEKLQDVQQIQAAQAAFAAILGDGSVVTWGHDDFGGNSHAVQGQLKDVQQIQASLHAFAAILGDGSVVTWGDARMGGNSDDVQHQLKDVRQIQATMAAFAAILGDYIPPWELFLLILVYIKTQGGYIKHIMFIKALRGVQVMGLFVTWGDAVPW